MENLRFRKRLSLFEQTLGRDACWVYPRKPNNSGYCIAHARDDDGVWHSVSAHKLAYLLLIGPYPETMIWRDGISYPTELDHVCKNRRCCNPWHLEPVPMMENWSRADSISSLRARQTHCKNGHPLSGENLIIRTSQNGRPSRVCRTCYNAWQRNRRAAEGERYRSYDRNRNRAAYAREWRARQPKKLRTLPTHCKHGHPLSGDNLLIYIRPNGRQKRKCRACNKRQCQEYYHSRHN